LIAIQCAAGFVELSPSQDYRTPEPRHLGDKKGIADIETAGRTGCFNPIIVLGALAFWMLLASACGVDTAPKEALINAAMRSFAA
jgi:hypothetical protein